MFLSDDFLLRDDWAKRLYHSYAKNMPIIDYHCHLDPKEICENNNFSNLTEAWLGGDHYKWCLIRACGVPEGKITGNTFDFEKFLAQRQTVPKIIGNSLYSWSRLELKHFFGIDLLINKENVKEIWTRASEILVAPDFRRREIAKESNAEVICTTDGPADDLHYHQLLAHEKPDLKVLSSFRPDKALNIEKEGFNARVTLPEEAADQTITTYRELIEVLGQQIEYFHQHGCRVSDHTLDISRYKEADETVLEEIFQKARANKLLSSDEIDAYRTETLMHLTHFYHSHNQTMQLHIHAYRNCNTQMLGKLGPGIGHDGVNDLSLIVPLRRLLNHVEETDQLPKMILYSLNPNDYPAILALMGCFQKEQNGKLQLGSGRWYDDTRAGIRDQLTQFIDGSALGNFVGMLIDSRNFPSYARHEYFRRALCEFLGEMVMRGEAPEDEQLLGGLVRAISYTNARDYFGFFA